MGDSMRPLPVPGFYRSGVVAGAEPIRGLSPHRDHGIHVNGRPCECHIVDNTTKRDYPTRTQSQRPLRTGLAASR